MEHSVKLQIFEKAVIILGRPPWGVSNDLPLPPPFFYETPESRELFGKKGYFVRHEYYIADEEYEESLWQKAKKFLEDFHNFKIEGQ